MKFSSVWEFTSVSYYTREIKQRYIDLFPCVFIRLRDTSVLDLESLVGQSQNERRQETPECFKKKWSSEIIFANTAAKSGARLQQSGALSAAPVICAPNISARPKPSKPQQRRNSPAAQARDLRHAATIVSEPDATLIPPIPVPSAVPAAIPMGQNLGALIKLSHIP